MSFHSCGQGRKRARRPSIGGGSCSPQLWITLGTTGDKLLFEASLWITCEDGTICGERPIRPTDDVRSFRVEEEFLLVDAATGDHAPVAEKLLDNHLSKAPVPGNSLTTEVQGEQLEAVSAPFTRLDDLAAALRAGKVEADWQAVALGARSSPSGPRHFPGCLAPRGRIGTWR